MPPEPDIVVTVDVARPPREVRAWWTEMPVDYRAADPKEQPHRIVTKERTPERWVVETYWRGPLGREVRLPETFRFRPDGWDVDIVLPFGLRQEDAFLLEATPTGTRVTIRVTVHAPTAGARLARPFFLRYAKRSYPATWHSAARLCERDAPRLG
jgi:hypothetical protein